MQKIFFTVLLVVTVLVTVRLHNYKQETTGLFANTAADETLIPGAVPPPAEEKADNAEDEDDGEFKEEHPEITAAGRFSAQMDFIKDFYDFHLLLAKAAPTFMNEKTSN